MGLVFAAAATLGAACAPGESSPETSRERRGDTVVVTHRGAGSWGGGAALERQAAFGEATGSDTALLGEIIAIAVGPDGRVFATDRQRGSVRVFDATLRPVGVWGRDGAGPGELRNPDGGLAVLTDGRVVVRDPGNARLQVFARDGTAAGTLAVIDAGLRTRENFGLHGDTLMSRVVVDASGPIDRWRYGFARLAPDGRVLDTVVAPTPDLPPATLVARRGGNTAELALPFAPASLSAWHPAGGFVTARGDRYAVSWPQGPDVLRIVREVPAVAVGSDEAAQERAYVTNGLRWLDPAWEWTGPEIPAQKPFVSQLFVGRDGSVWVLREGPAEDRPDPDFRPGDPYSVERRLRSQLTFDVFESDGTFLGSLAVPRGVQLRPQPAFDAQGFVALDLDDEGVPRLVRYRVRVPPR